MKFIYRFRLISGGLPLFFYTILFVILFINGCKSKEIKEALDDNGDGIYETWRYYKDGQLIRVEKDLFLLDGKIDTWEYYSGGKLVSIENDRNGDGKIDRRYTSHMGREFLDDDFDGNFEKEIHR